MHDVQLVRNDCKREMTKRNGIPAIVKKRSAQQKPAPPTIDQLTQRKCEGDEENWLISFARRATWKVWVEEPHQVFRRNA